MEAHTVSIFVPRDWREVYEAIWRPECFPQWASGLACSEFAREGDRWLAVGPDGPVRIRFTDRNAFGVMDHVVEVPGAPDIHVPMRVVANGSGAEVLLTLFRQPGMTQEKFQEDAAWVNRDLSALRRLLSEDVHTAR